MMDSSNVSSLESPIKPLKSPIKPVTTPTINNTTPTSSNSKKRKRLTPDERLSSEKERAEKRQKLEEERIRKEEEKRQREQERVEKARIKEQERIEKEHQKEQERLKREALKEQERLKKEEEIAKKNEEKRKKEEERLKREEEKRKANEEKEKERLKREEEKRKAIEEKEKERLKLEEKAAKQKITKFFVQKSPATTSKVKTLEIGTAIKQQANSAISANSAIIADSESDKENKGDISASAPSPKEETFEITDEQADVQILLVKRTEATLFSPMPFQIKTYMAVAPIVRRVLTSDETKVLDSVINNISSENEMDLDETLVAVPQNKWKSELIERVKRKEIRKSGRTEVEYDGDSDVRIVMEDVIEPGAGYKRYRMKLLQFDENRRPAYWGTWKRKSMAVRGTHPYAKEAEIDYEFDSDDEWEDEPEDAEEIENSDGEEEKEDPAEGEPVDEDDEEGWMVPHGYLSDSERNGEHMDLEIVKSKEKEFYRSLKEQVKMGIPVIQTDNLSEFRIVFPPPSTHRIRRSHRAPKPVNITSETQFQKGFLALDLPSDDEHDGDWIENNSEEGDGDDENSDNDSVSSESDGSEEDSEVEEIEEEEMEVDEESESL